MIIKTLSILLLTLSILASQEKVNVKYIDNGIIKLGIDTNKGGAITYLASSKGGKNLINNFDLGRQIQMSFYSGPIPYSANGQSPAKNWTHIGWNPIQSGDDFDNNSTVKELKVKENSIYLKCIPMQWPLNNISGDCFFELWVSLQENAVHYKAKLTNLREDRNQYMARHQELPAVYLNSDYFKMVTYKGTAPFTNGKLHINSEPLKPGQHWHLWEATENWAAYVDKTDVGLGVFKPDTRLFTGGFAGRPESGGSAGNSTAYLAPLETEIIDHNIEYEYETYLILGSIGDIRKFVYAHKPPLMKQWDFKKDRQHWSIVGNTDTGWPLKEALCTTNKRVSGSYFISPLFLLNSSELKSLVINAKYSGTNSHFFISFDLFESDLPTKPFAVKTVKDHKLNTYKINLKDIPGLKGFIKKLRIFPFSESAELNETVEIKSVEFK